MKAKLLFRAAFTALLVCILCTGASAQNKKRVREAAAATAEFQLPSTETDEQRDARMKWWTDARFGMFIHWGLYALPARHEWVKYRDRLTDDGYQKYFDHFEPDLFDPEAWAKSAKAAGMKYVVITSKHHEGFCMWDSQYTDYKVTNTPIGRDLLKEFIEAFRKEGIRIGLYYSLIDWHHPDFTIDSVHPQRISNVRNPDEDVLAGYARLNEGRDMSRYRQYMKDQVRELLTNYGPIDVMWFDFSYAGTAGKDRNDWDSEGLLKLTKNLQPNIIVNSRLDLRDVKGGWDFVTAEQYKVASHPVRDGKPVPWETCQTFSGSWGYYRDETSWKNPHQLIGLLAETVSKGGNLIMNVGPTARGEFDYRATDRLDAFADWMHSNSRSIYCCTEAPERFKAPANTVLTYNPETNRLYVHLLDYPMGRLNFDFADEVEYAQFLHDASEITIEQTESGDTRGNSYFVLPILKPEVEVPVIEIYLKQ